MKQKKAIGRYIEGIFYFLLLSSVFFLNFKKIRSLFPGPSIEGNNIVGYSQYFGYPFYFDTFVFFLFLASPVLVILLIKIRKGLFFVKDD